MDSLEVLALSHNSITGVLPVNLPWNNLLHFDVSYNMLLGPLPLPNSRVVCFATTNNNFSGTLHSLICQFTSLEVLDLSSNILSGEFPHCLGNLSEYLEVLNLGSNNFHGTLPASFSKCDYLEYLDVNNNMLHGLVPWSLSSCESLELLNLQNNNFKDEFPYWLQNLSRLQVLDLSSNKFHGDISPSNTKHPFPLLQVIDLSNNNFTGKLPESYTNKFRAMMNASDNFGTRQYMSAGEPDASYSFSMRLIFNGVENDFIKIISTLTIIDLSNNAFEGDIPYSIGGLVGLHGLNLSYNRLTGHIPQSLGNLLLLNFLDLSNNKLSGSIPRELASLTSLGVFNVSENQLAGAIPHGNNFNTFPPESYEGNLGLCGFPLPECGDNHRNAPSSPSASDEITRGGTLVEWEVVLMGCGFGTILGLAWGAYMLSIGKPVWPTNLACTFELLVVRAFRKPLANCARSRPGN